jgi:hypothetical protein
MRALEPLDGDDAVQARFHTSPIPPEPVGERIS